MHGYSGMDKVGEEQRILKLMKLYPVNKVVRVGTAVAMPFSCSKHNCILQYQSQHTVSVYIIAHKVTVK